MKTISLVSSLIVSSALFTGHAFAVSQPPISSSSDLPLSKQNVEKQKRSDLTYQIVKKWGAHVQEAYLASPKKWAMDMAPLFRSSSMDVMQRAANAKTFDAMNDVLLQNDSAIQKKGASNKAVSSTTKSLGSLTDDLVYRPVTPCRIFDTRVVGGALAPISVRHFDITSNSDYSYQGGDSASHCDIVGSAPSFAAAVINFTVVSPTSQGFVTAYAYGTPRPTASTLVFAPGTLISNTAIVRLDQGTSGDEMSVYSSTSVHLVGDIVGYFDSPQETRLECVDTAMDTVHLWGGNTPNSIGIAIAPQCPTGYTQTATNCDGGLFTPITYSKSGVCTATNNGVYVTDHSTLSASRTCCRVPGR